MTDLVTYASDGSVATITMDDGKVNALSPAMQAAIGTALDRAEAEGAVVVLKGRPGVFSAGFDLQVLRGGGADGAAMVIGGFELAHRMLSFPRPVLMACTGHAIAMGVFLLQAGDYRIGAAGAFRLTANEVALGMTMPHAAIEIIRQRLSPAALSRALITADVYEPDTAREAGFLDRVVPADELDAAIDATSAQLASLHAGAHAATKLRLRAPALDAIRAGIDADRAELAAIIGS